MNFNDIPNFSEKQKKARAVDALYDDLARKIDAALRRTIIEDIRSEIEKLVRFLIESMQDKNQPLLLYTGKILDEEYTSFHALNVCLISLKIGIRLGINPQRLNALGSLSLIHSKIKEESFKTLQAQYSDEDALHEIVRLADVYDALTHPPRYRHTQAPSETLIAIISSHKFNAQMVKILFEEISLYPQGTWVQLSTNEVAKVTQINKRFPMRPLVTVYVSWEGTPLKEPKAIDLSEKSLVYILRPLAQDEVNHLEIEER